MSQSTPLPVIRKALGDRWDELETIVKRHYDITPGNKTSMTIKGVMGEVYHSKIAKLFLLPGRLFGALVPYQGKNIPTEVRNWTTNDNSMAMFWHRTLHFPDKAPVIFSSRMEHINGNEIVEYVKHGMGIRMLLSEHDASLVFKGIGYVWKIGHITLHIPNWMILGDAVIIEKALSETAFFMDFKITHPLFGRTFSYSGTFAIDESDG
ncbi:MAG: DUF4166 domain-containing protein [Candidatus Thiodiazotropha sp. (ex Epidulcina cf. delphinae)]|nr:DUF4166 domain-containing protein [Candidatus Thiodiazotropha sp. (ex Epidulcina cf. delphinae)]